MLVYDYEPVVHLFNIKSSLDNFSSTACAAGEGRFLSLAVYLLFHHSQLLWQAYVYSMLCQIFPVTSW